MMGASSSGADPAGSGFQRGHGGGGGGGGPSMLQRYSGLVGRHSVALRSPTRGTLSLDCAATAAAAKAAGIHFATGGDEAMMKAENDGGLGTVKYGPSQSFGGWRPRTSPVAAAPAKRQRRVAPRTPTKTELLDLVSTRPAFPLPQVLLFHLLRLLATSSPSLLPWLLGIFPRMRHRPRFSPSQQRSSSSPPSLEPSCPTPRSPRSATSLPSSVATPASALTMPSLMPSSIPAGSPTRTRSSPPFHTAPSAPRRNPLPSPPESAPQRVPPPPESTPCRIHPQ